MKLSDLYDADRRRTDGRVAMIAANVHGRTPEEIKARRSARRAKQPTLAEALGRAFFGRA